MQTPLRYAVRVTAVSVPLVLVLGAPATASATAPVGWDGAPPVSLLEALLLFGGVPLGLFLLITFLTVAPGLARGDRSGGVDRWATPQWFNGPRAGESVEGTAGPRALGGSAGTGGADSYAGASSADAPAPDDGASGAGPAPTPPAGQPTEEARGRPPSPDADAGPARDVVPVAADTGGGASARW